MWNHTFYWNCLKRGGGGKPTGKLAQMIDTAFGSYDNVQEGIRERVRHAVRLGLGLARAEGGEAQDREDAERRDAVHQGPDAAADDRRLGARVLPRLPEPPRRDYVNAVIDKLLNWDFAAENLG